MKSSKSGHRGFFFSNSIMQSHDPEPPITSRFHQFRVVRPLQMGFYFIIVLLLLALLLWMHHWNSQHRSRWQALETDVGQFYNTIVRSMPAHHWLKMYLNFNLIYIFFYFDHIFVLHIFVNAGSANPAMHCAAMWCRCTGSYCHVCSRMLL